MVTLSTTAPLDSELVDRLLDLLSTDDAYRERFQNDPRAALQEIGYESPAPGKMTACGVLVEAAPEALIDCKVEVLASKETIAASRSEIQSMLTRGLAQTTPNLDALSTSSRRARK